MFLLCWTPSERADKLRGILSLKRKAFDNLKNPLDTLLNAGAFCSVGADDEVGSSRRAVVWMGGLASSCVWGRGEGTGEGGGEGRWGGGEWEGGSGRRGSSGEGGGSISGFRGTRKDFVKKSSEVAITRRCKIFEE